MEERILELLQEKERSIHELQALLALNNSEGFTVLLKALNHLEDEGKVVRNEKNEYLLIENSNYIVGVLHINKRGFGFVIIDEESEDIFISSRDLKDAFNMDTVMVELKKHQTGSRKEGRIVKVIQRGQTRLVGLLKNAKRELVFDADDQKFNQPIYIDHAHSHGAVAGHKVVVEIKTYKPYLKGNVVEIIGHVGDPGVDILSVVSQHEAHVEFPKEVYEQIESIENEIDQEEAKTRTVQQAPDIFDFFFGDGRGQQRQVQSQPRVGFGSGVIISKDGYIVTNNHVIEGADEISVKLNDNREFKGRVIGTDPSTDLALVKIEGDDFPTIPVGDSEALKVGEWVLAVGNPFNLNSTVTAGIVSAKARSLGVYNGGIESFIQTDAAINQGNSGGALVNAKGELVGINSVLSSPTGAYAGYGFAIPTSIMTKVIADLKQYGTVQRALLGIRGGSIGSSLMDDRQPIDKSGKTLADKAKELGVVEGVWVSEIVENGSAAGADIKVDDVIIGVDNKKVSNMADLQEALAKHRPGDKVKVKLMRDKKEKTVEVTLKNEQGTTKIVKDAGMEILGAAFKELPDDLKKQLNLGYGLQVTGVSSGKMSDAGVRKGFIILKANDQPMRKVSDLEEVMKAAVKSPNQVLFLTGVFPSGKRGYFAVDLTQE